MDIVPTVYFNQRGAGNGKTFESIQLLNGNIIDKNTYLQKHVYIYTHIWSHPPHDHTLLVLCVFYTTFLLFS